MSVPRILRLLATAALGLSIVATATPASAQYAGTLVTLIVDPIRVPEGSPIHGLGLGCAGGTTVTITLVDPSTVLTTVTAEDDSGYQFDGVALPPGLTLGAEYEVTASCPGSDPPTPQIITVVCASGDDPDAEGLCPGGASQVPPTTTIVTGSTTVDDPLAFTGANTVVMVQSALSLIGLGALLMVVGRRRDRRRLAGT